MHRHSGVQPIGGGTKASVTDPFVTVGAVSELTNETDIATVNARDSLANIGNYTPFDGAMYYADDTGQTYRGNGSIFVAWTPLSQHQVKRVQTVTPDSAAITADADNYDDVILVTTVASGTLTMNAPTGTPIEGQLLLFKVKCTNSQSWSFNAIFRGGVGVVLPTDTTTAKTDYLGFRYNATDTKWDLLARASGY